MYWLSCYSMMLSEEENSQHGETTVAIQIKKPEKKKAKKYFSDLARAGCNGLKGQSHGISGISLRHIGVARIQLF